MAHRIRPVEERLWAKVNKNGPVPAYRPDLGPCWIWTGCLNKHGYGKISMGLRGGSIRGTHVVAYELLVGNVPGGLELDHLCRVRACLNPLHLEPVTGAENMRRAMEARTHCDRGHLFNEANTRWYRGHRLCRACDREDAARRRQAPPPGTRHLALGVKLSDADAALVDLARGDERRAPWMRAVILVAARDGLMVPSNPQDAGPRHIQVVVMAHSEEAAAIEAARGDRSRATWMRDAALSAAA